MMGTMFHGMPFALPDKCRDKPYVENPLDE
jgi:hypothetical protein